MEIAERILGSSIKHEEFFQSLKSFIELPEATQQKLFEAYISLPSGRHFYFNSEKLASILEIDELHKVANNQDYQVFTSSLEKLDLTKLQADEISKMIELCVSLDMIALAFDLATKAKAIYPEHHRIESAYKAFSPPKVIGTSPAQATGMEKSHKWFNENSCNHKGKWVAVNNGSLLAEADSLKELNDKIDEKYLNPSTIVEKIFNNA